VKELILELVKNVPPDWRIILLSAIPITELRASIPLALYLGMPPMKAFFLGVTGNIIPVLPILYLLNPAVKILERIPFMARFFEWLFARTRHKGGQIQKYGLLGLLLFVGIPLPGTGAWTGSLLAFLFGLPILKSFIAISSGVILAGVLVTLAGVGAFKVISLVSIEYVLIVLIIGIGIWFWFKKRR